MMNQENQIKRTGPKPVELYGEETSREGCTAIVYIGNGAASQTFTELFEQGHIDGTAYEGLGGKADLCAIQYISASEPLPLLLQGFTHEEGTFAGYTVRRKNNGIWEWYCIDHQWHSVDDDMPEKIRYQAGEIPDFETDGYLIFVFEAKWTDPQGTNLDCGYMMFRNRFMAHAFGGMKGKQYHNTMAAYRRGILKGYKFHEVDLSMTVDGRLVLCHGWKESHCVHTGFRYSPELEKTMTYEKVMGMKVHGNPIIDARKFYRYMRLRKKDVYEIDFHKQHGEAAENRIRAMLEDFHYDESVLDRLLIQIYNRKMYTAVDGTWHFKHYMYLVGRSIHKLDDLISFLVEEGICGVVIRAHLAKSECVRKLHNADIYVMGATVGKDVVAANQLFHNGVDTICTDYLTEKRLKKNTSRMGHYPFYLYYNSGVEDVCHEYDALGFDKERIVRTNANYVEFMDPEIWKNDGNQQLRKCTFTTPGRRFAGWYLRMKVDGVWYWFCQDEFYHARKEFGMGEHAWPKLFSDQETLPVLTVRNHAQLVMHAVWDPPVEEQS